MRKLLAVRTGNATTFTVWAPLKNKMILHIVHPNDEEYEMKKDDEGYFEITIDDLPSDTKYFFKPEGEKDLPDPASQFQSEGVHGPSQVVDHLQYQWNDQLFRGMPLKEMIIYELHVGTFTQEGTFEAVIPRLDDLLSIGINTIEIMPVAQFPGNRNWGYDGVFPYAVQSSYGGPTALKKLVDAAHQKGMSVILDVVYNHIGPEGNYLPQFAPYFTDKYWTPWGDAINFDKEWSDGVREYFVQNMIHWFEHYHIDALRLDAIHAVHDESGIHFWGLLHDHARITEQRLGRKLFLIAESDLNDPKVVRHPELNGYGFDAQWLDDFHHALYVLLHPQGRESYIDFGHIEQLAKAYKDGFVHSGEYVRFRKKKFGRSSAGIPADKFVVFNQNHDQVGNRVRGERLSLLVDFERQKLAAAAIMLSPYIPLLFMGEEYAEDNPFYYFVSHSDKDLIKAVQEGRKKEFENFNWNVTPPDPQDEKTFNDSKLDWGKRNEGKHKIMMEWMKKLIELRKTIVTLQNVNKNDINVVVLEQSGIGLHRQNAGGKDHVVCLFNFSEKEVHYTFPDWSNEWEKILNSKEEQWLEERIQSTSTLPNKTKSSDTILIPPLSASVFKQAQ